MAATSVTSTRYHLSTLFLLLFYLPLIVLPWVVQCILDVRPMTRAGSSYVANRGEYSPKDIAAVGSWMRTAAVLNVAAAALAVPAVSTVLAHAAVVMIHRRDPSRPLNLRKLLSLADNPWTRMPDQRGSRFVFAGLALVALSVVVPLFQLALVIPEPIRVASCQDTPEPTNPSDICDSYYDIGYTIVGPDAEPAVLDATAANLMSQRVGHRLQTIHEEDSLPYIWYEDPDGSYAGYTTKYPTLYELYKIGTDPKPYFVSALPHDTNTGVLRVHALRMNSTTICEDVSTADFPEPCPGDRPFAGEFSTALTTVRFCAPGAYDTAPWTLSRNRQDITEEVYFNISVPENSTIGVETILSVRCEVNSTRGYFELPNYYNNGFPGPLLENWPSYQELKENFNDYIGRVGIIMPSESDPLDDLGFHPRFPPTPYGSDSSGYAPGPLMTFLVSALGNYSFFATASNASTAEEHGAASIRICESGLPLEYLETARTHYQCHRAVADSNTAQDPSGGLSNIVYAWFASIVSSHTNESIGAGIYLAQEQYLTTAAAAGRYAGKIIYTAPGTMITKPNVPLGVKVFVSILLCIQVVALLGVAGYIYSTRTFGTSIDAVAVMVFGIRAASKLGGAASVPRLGQVREIDLMKLEKVDGMAVLHEAATGSALGGTGADGDMELVERCGFRMSDETVLPAYDTVVRGTRD